MIEQVSIQAFGRAGCFWDLPEDEAVPTLAVAFHRRTAEGSASCVLPACSADLVHLWNVTRPKSKKEETDGEKESREYMSFGKGG
jgi:hypothetical protein